MSFLTLEFVIIFLKVLNLDFPLILISLDIVKILLLLLMALIELIDFMMQQFLSGVTLNMLFGHI